MPQDIAALPQTGAPKRAAPRIITVKRAYHLTPHMIRVIFAGPELAGIAPDCAGANCKLLLPGAGESRADFAARLAAGGPITRRTYTIRWYDPEALEMAIDFFDHGVNGPASAWANAAVEGSFLGLGGPGTPKVTSYTADWYLIAADMSALPVAAATLAVMPADARGVALFEITSPEDRQDFAIPPGIEVHWLVHPEPHHDSTAQIDFVRAMDWPQGRVQTCIAGETSVIKALRGYLHQDRAVPRADTYISGYWKIGMVEDEHQAMKRAEAS